MLVPAPRGPWPGPFGPEVAYPGCQLPLLIRRVVPMETVTDPQPLQLSVRTE